MIDQPLVTFLDRKCRAAVEKFRVWDRGKLAAWATTSLTLVDKNEQEAETREPEM